MSKNTLRYLCAGLLPLLQLACGSPANSDAPAFLQIELRVPDYRDLSTGSTWTSTGAFIDSGQLDRAGEQISAPRGLPAQGALRVTASFVSTDGSTLTWSFERRYYPTDDPAIAVSPGTWYFVAGTGRYVGIQGHGEVTGTLNVVTGEIKDTFTGWVDFPPGLTP